MGGNIVFRGKLVTYLFLICLASFGRGCSFPNMGDRSVLYSHFDYASPVTGLSTTIEVSFREESIIVPVGERLTIWIRLSNRGDLPIDVVELPISNFMEELDAERDIWQPMLEGTPFLLEGDGIYLSEGIKGFYPIDQIQAMRNIVLEAGQEEYSWSCIPPVYMLRGKMTVDFLQDLTFLRKGHWRLVYNINGNVHYRNIISQ